MTKETIDILVADRENNLIGSNDPDSPVPVSWQYSLSKDGQILKITIAGVTDLGDFGEIRLHRWPKRSGSQEA